MLQFELFESIRPLFQRKPLVVVANKCDVKRLDELSDENKVKQLRQEDKHVTSHACMLSCGYLLLQELYEALKKDDISVFEMSTLTEEGIMNVKMHVR